MATSLPLPRGFFTAAGARPSEDQRRQYIEFAESSIRKVFALSDCHRNSWIPVREKKGVAVFRNFGTSRGPHAHKSNIAEVGGKGDVHASLDEVARAYAAHDDALFTRLMKKLNGGVMDAAVVATVVPRSPLAPYRYIGIKWFAVKTPTPLVSHRDYCCLEVQDKIVDAYGNEMYIRILNSIEIKECPSLENSHGLVRAKMLAGYMYRADRAEPSVVRIHHVARFDPAGYFPSQWAYKMAESQLVSSIVQIKRVVEKQQMNACTFVDKKQWVPNHERLHCAVCSRPFGTFRPRHHCRCCGEVICGKCSVFKSVDMPGTTLKNVRICSICNMGVQKSHHDGAGANDDTMSDISTSSVTSSSTIAHNEMNLMDLYLSANGNPGTPSAYSTASAQSNLSIRSTASSRSVIDARGRNNSSTPGTARFFKGGSGQAGQNIFSSSSRVTTAFAPPSAGTHSAATTPARSRGGSHTPRALFNETNTPRSYIGGSMTPHRHVLGFFGPAAAPTPVAASAQAAEESPEDSSEHELRKSIFKQNPLDLGYLRDSVRNTQTIPTSTPAPTPAEAGKDSTQMMDVDQSVASEPVASASASEEEPVRLLPSNEAELTGEGLQTTVENSSAAPVAVPSSVESEAASQNSTSASRSRGRSSIGLLPPAKMPRIQDEDIEMEDVAATGNQKESSNEPAADAQPETVTESPSKDTFGDISLLGFDDPIRSNANSTSTTESSTGVAAAVQPFLTTPSTPRKSFLAGLFSRSSLESKPAAA